MFITRNWLGEGRVKVRRAKWVERLLVEGSIPPPLPLITHSERNLAVKRARFAGGYSAIVVGGY
jgi:hypothetical protein